MRTPFAVALMAALVFGAANPAVAEALPTRPFALWPPNFCARSAGNGEYRGANEYYIATATASMKAGPDGVCNDPSPASAGAFAAMPVLEVFFAPMGGWIGCRYEAEQRAVNAEGAPTVVSRHTVFGCGAAPHRLRSGSRITYGGTDHHDVRYTGDL